MEKNIKVKINNVEIDGYGKLKELLVDFDKGFNLVYGRNESGKTTLYSFFKHIMYGFVKGKQKKLIKDKKLEGQFAPWKAASFSGSMIVEKEDGDFAVNADFNKNTFELLNISTNSVENYKDPRKLGYFLTGLEQDIFSKIVQIELRDIDLDVLSVEDSNKFISSYFLEEISNTNIDSVESVINKEKSEIGTRNTPTKLYARTINDIEVLKGDVARKYSLEANLDLLMEDKVNLISKIKILTNKLRYYSSSRIKLLNIEKEMKILEEKYSSDILNFDFSAIKGLTKEIKSLENSKNEIGFSIKKNFILRLILTSITFVILSIICYGAYKYYNNYFKHVLIASLSIFLIISQIGKSKKTKEKFKIVSDELGEKLEKLATKKGNMGFDDENIDQISFDSEEYKLLKRNYDILHEASFNYSYLEEFFNSGTNSNQIKEELTLMSSNKSVLEFKIRTLEKELLKIRDKEEELNCLQNEKLELERKIKINNLILSSIDDAKDFAFKDFNKNMLINVSSIFSELTDNKYESLVIDEKHYFKVFDKASNKYVSIGELSSGTIQLFFLSLRLAIRQSLNLDDKLPIILDESVFYMDNKRRKNVLDYLLNLSKKTQIIYFTNDDFDKEHLSKSKIKIIEMR